MEAAWRDPTQPDVSSPEGQRKLAAEIRRLKYQRLDALRLKQPGQYRAFDQRIKFLAGFVVRERTNRFGVTVRVRRGPDGIALPVGQGRLDA